MKNSNKLPAKQTSTLGVFKSKAIKSSGFTASSTDTPSVVSLSSSHLFNR